MLKLIVLTTFTITVISGGWGTGAALMCQRQAALARQLRVRVACYAAPPPPRALRPLRLVSLVEHPLSAAAQL